MNLKKEWIKNRKGKKVYNWIPAKFRNKHDHHDKRGDGDNKDSKTVKGKNK